MTSALDRLPPRARELLRPQEQPEWTAPMLAVLTNERFSDPGWIYERKLDGERCLAFRHGGRLRLLSRTRQPLNEAYPELVGPLEAQRVDDFIVDGEIVAFEGPRTSFERLQRRIQLRDPASALRSGVAVFYYLFDILHLEGNDTSALQLRDRKSLLRNALSYGDPLRFLPHRNTEGEALYRDACRRGWEGLIAKRADAPYRHAGGAGGAADRLLRPRCAALRRQGRHRLQPGRAAGPAVAARPAGTRRAAVRARRAAAEPRPLGAPRAGRPDRLHRGHPRRQAAPPPLPGPARRQAPARGGPGTRPPPLRPSSSSRARAPHSLTGAGP